MPIRPPARLLAPILFEREQLIHAVGQTINLTFDAAEAGCVGQAGEVDKLVYFFLEGLPLIEEQFNRILHPYGVHATLSGIFCHQTPKVNPQPTPTHKPSSCELGDILFLVTYGRRLYDRFLGNALLVQAKEDAAAINGSVQEFLYQTADGFTYFTPGPLTGQSRDLSECHNSLWFWDFNGRHWWHPLPFFWRTTGISARRRMQFRHHRPFEFVLLDLICGVSGRRVRMLNANSPENGWSKIVDDLIRVTARSAFRRQNAYVTRNRQPLRGEDAVRAVNITMGSPPPFLVRSSLERIFRIFDEEMAKLGAELERHSQGFDEEKFKHENPRRFVGGKSGADGPPILGNERLAAPDGDDGGCSFVLLDFSG
jgi:hypothetical protein